MAVLLFAGTLIGGCVAGPWRRIPRPEPFVVFFLEVRGWDDETLSTVCIMSGNSVPGARKQDPAGQEDERPDSLANPVTTTFSPPVQTDIRP